MSPLSQTLTGQASGVLLLVGKSEETAKRIESFLRNAGHPLRCAWTNEMAEMEDVLLRSPPDLLLLDDAHAATDPEQTIRRVAELRPDMPTLIIGQSLSPDDVTAALTIGAKDYVCSKDLQHLRHLELVVVREFVNHHHLRTLRLTRERLADFEARHTQLLEGSADAIAHIREGILCHVNAAFAKLVFVDHEDQLIGQPLIDLVAEDQRVRVKERLRVVLKGKHNGEPLEFNLLAEGTRAVPVSAQLILGSEDGEQVIEMLVRSIASGHALGDSVVASIPVAATSLLPPGASTVPALTTAAYAARPAAGGRAGFLRAIASPDQQVQGPHGAVMVVVDHFSALEDRIGMTNCEEVVDQLFDAVKTRLGPVDSAYAFSASEIGLVVSRSKISEIEAFAKQLRSALSEQIFTTREHEAQLTFSVVVYPMGGTEKPEQVVTEVVREARRLSEKGGNQITILGEAAQASQNDREQARKAAMVKKALEENRLKLAYQSIASLEGDSRQHFDVLVRLLDENGKELHAGEFLPAAEKFGLMRNVDRWVLARCLAIIAKRAGGAEAPSLFVKVSEDSLKDAEAYVKWVSELLKAYPLKHEEFVFEIQEAILQNYVRKAKGITTALSSLGAGIAIDHFGNSTNSVQLLEHLPKINYVKFHASFTQKFNDKDVQRRMAQLMEIAKQKKIKTIVSHVEDANVMARLWQMGVNYIQGYHVQEPEVVLLASEFITKAMSIHAVR